VVFMISEQKHTCSVLPRVHSTNRQVAVSLYWIHTLFPHSTSRRVGINSLALSGDGKRRRGASGSRGLYGRV
jgi:hypothetical protein